MAQHLPESSSVTVSRRSRAESFHREFQQDERALNDRAVSVLRRVKSKLGGNDFPDQAATLDVATQVHRLIVEAQSELNLCQLYVGWCSFWCAAVHPAAGCIDSHHTASLADMPLDQLLSAGDYNPICDRSAHMVSIKCPPASS